MLLTLVLPDLGMKKKKKKSKKEGDDEFAAKLAALDIDKEDAEEGEAVQDGDMYVALSLCCIRGMMTYTLKQESRHWHLGPR